MVLADRADRLPGGGVLSAMDAEVERTLRAALAATPSGRSYWLFAGDGGISAFGDAEFLGDRRWATASAPTVAFAAVAAG